MKIFYVDALLSDELQKFPLVAACYPQRIILNAKTKKEAINEAWKIQKERDAHAWDLIERMKTEGHDWKRAYVIGPCYRDWLYCFDSESGKTSHIADPKAVCIKIKSRKLGGRVFLFRTRPNDRGVYACEDKNGCALDLDGRPLPSDQLGTFIGAVPDADEWDTLFGYEVNRIARYFYRRLLANATAGA